MIYGDIMAEKKKKLPPVKCIYCGEQFDRATTEYIAVTTRRYAHKACADKHDEQVAQETARKEAEKTKEERDLEILRAYIKKIFKLDNRLNETINTQIKRYHTQNNYSYQGMYKTLCYFYDIKKNPVRDSTIGIIPYVYDDAHNYYTAIWMAQQQNIAKPIEQYKPNIVEVHIPPPTRKPIKQKQFSFLEEDD